MALLRRRPSLHASSSAIRLTREPRAGHCSRNPRADAGSIAAFVAGVGTGAPSPASPARCAQELGKRVKIVAVERQQRRAQRQPAWNDGIQGSARLRARSLGARLIDEVVEAPTGCERMARGWRARRAARRSSSGANVHAACEVASRLGWQRRPISCDSGERYWF